MVESAVRCELPKIHQMIYVSGTTLESHLVHIDTGAILYYDTPRHQSTHTATISYCWYIRTPRASE